MQGLPNRRQALRIMDHPFFFLGGRPDSSTRFTFMTTGR